jgi:hypothetical protein
MSGKWRVPLRSSRRVRSSSLAVPRRILHVQRRPQAGLSLEATHVHGNAKAASVLRKKAEEAIDAVERSS